MQKTPLPPLAVLYGRVSTDQQTTSTQEARCKEYLIYKHLPLDAEFYDEDVSGSIAIWDRPNGRKLRERLKAGGVKHLVVAKLDRLGRKATDLLKTVEMLDEMKIVLHIVDLGGDSLSTQGAAGRLMLTVLAGMAEYERELIRDRITKHLDAKRDRDELCGTEPFGFTAVATGEVTPKGKAIKRLEPNPEEQKWIVFMAAQYDAGFGYHTIAKQLNAAGVPTKRRGEILNLLHGGHTKASVEKRFTSGRWQAGNVARVLQSKTAQSWLAERAVAPTEAAA